MTLRESFLSTPTSQRLVRELLKMVTFHGGRTNTHGSCPGCGCEVRRRHTWTTREASDVYDCPSCGTFAYRSDGAVLPSQPPADLVNVLDPIDCIG